jgi:hypothetical protein
MQAVLDPKVSEFETDAQAASYDRWLRAKVERALKQADEPATPKYSTDEVMQRMDNIIKTAEAKHAARRLA